MDDEIDLRDIFRVLWKSRVLITGFFMMAMLVSGVVSFSTPPAYKVSGIIALGNYNDSIYTSQAPAMNLMISDGFLLDVIEQLSFDVPSDKFDQFKNDIEVTPVNGADNLLIISVKTAKSQEGREIVEKMILLFANRSEKNYNIQKKSLLDRLAKTKGQLTVVENDINQTRKVLTSMENAPGVSPVEKELRISRTLEYLQGEESRRSSLIDRYLSLQKQSDLFRNVDAVQTPKEPVSPMKTQRALMVAISGLLGLMIGIFAAFLRGGLGRKVE